jgi:hypothetical protein
VRRDAHSSCDNGGIQSSTQNFASRPTMEPILKSHFSKFKRDFEIDTKDDSQKEASAFERFVNYVLFSLD